MKKRNIRILYELAVLALTVCLLWTALFRLGCYYMPERTLYGSVWSSYLQEEPNSVDVLFLGSSRAYCNVIPAEIYEQTGLSSYVMAGPAQTVSLTYYYLRECLKTQTPQAVFVEVSGAFYPASADHSKDNVCYMPWGLNRILAAAACEDGILELALYPLQEFHSRAYEPNPHPASNPEGVMLCGYTPLDKAEPQQERTLRRTGVKPDSEQYENNLGYLRKIATLCRDRGIACVFFMAPSMNPYPAQMEARLFADLRALPCSAAEDWQDLVDELGIDAQTDWYDNIHFNTRGAEKFTAHLSGYLQDLGLSPARNADAELWSRRIAWLNDKT